MARVLVVEDDASQLEIRKQILEHAGHEVIIARDASEALERWQGCPMVVMDLRIPESEDGLRLIQAIAGKARIIVFPAAKWIPSCLWMSSSRSPAHPDGCWKASADGHPHKSGSQKFEDRAGRYFAGWNVEDQGGSREREGQSESRAGGVSRRPLGSGEEPHPDRVRRNVATQKNSGGRVNRAEGDFRRAAPHDQ